MKIKELESELGLSRHTIRYYEKEGLLKPSKSDNGYREYDEEDINQLRIIKELRNLGVSMDDIKAYLENYITLDECLLISNQNAKNQIETYQNIVKQTNSLLEKKLPDLPELIVLEAHDEALGFKTTPFVTIGRKMTQKTALIKWITTAFITILFGQIFFALNHSVLLDVYPKAARVIDLLMFVLLHSFLFGSNFQWTVLFTGNYVDQTLYEYVELQRDGIHVRDKGSFSSRLKYLYDTMLKKSIVEDFYPYEDVASLDVSMKDGKTLYSTFQFVSEDVRKVDFEFKFMDGKMIKLYNPIISKSDKSYLVTILKSKINEIHDPYQYLTCD